MFKRLLSKILREFRSALPISKNRPIIISFTGGLGAQIISAAIYFNLKSQGYNVYGDFNYFLQKDKKSRNYSIWDWQLGCFGLNISDFLQLNSQHIATVFCTYIPDGKVKSQLSKSAFKNKTVINIFKNHTDEFMKLITSILDANKGLNEEYICIHMRRGDYLNVASHIISDQEFLNIVPFFKSFIKNIVIISDASLTEEFKIKIKSNFSNPIFFDSGKIDAASSHYIMANANILICSNSQFSLTAGQLNSNLVLIPRKWYGNDSYVLESIIYESSKFILLE